MPELSPKEIQILRLLARGVSDKSIAQALDVAHATARNRVSQLLQKLGVTNRTQAVVWAFKAGIIKLEDIHFKHND